VQFRRKNIRLNKINYRGPAWFFITLCCELRRPVFANDNWARRLIDCLRSTSETCHFRIHAFCVMPDHFHGLVEGIAPDSDLLLFVGNFKRATSLEYSLETGAPLWQKKFYDHILRPGESPDAVAWYIWMNPVRTGLCPQPDRYPYSGSFTGKWENLSPPRIEWIPAWKKIGSVSLPV
jgi:putative transposase